VLATRCVLWKCAEMGKIGRIALAGLDTSVTSCWVSVGGRGWRSYSPRSDSTIQGQPGSCQPAVYECASCIGGACHGMIAGGLGPMTASHDRTAVTQGTKECSLLQ